MIKNNEIKKPIKIPVHLEHKGKVYPLIHIERSFLL